MLETKEKTRDGEDGGEEERRNVLAHLHNAVSMQDLDESGTWRYGAAGLIVLYFVVGVVYYTQFSVPDNFRAIDALYFCVVTITTVGYGDTNTEYDEDGSDRDMIFTSFFVLLGVGLVGAALGVRVGSGVGFDDGAGVGAALGVDVGSGVGICDGAGVGAALGAEVGSGVGICDGAGVGATLGAGVNAITNGGE